jgi:hypothetical protein
MAKREEKRKRRVSRIWMYRFEEHVSQEAFERGVSQ